MGLTNLLMCSIFFKAGEDIPLYGNAEKIERGRLYQKANDIGTSRFSTYLSDPQPLPLIKINTDSLFAMGDIQGVEIKENSTQYFNSRKKPLGGIMNLNFEELDMLIKKHFD